MRKSRFGKAQIVAIVREYDAGARRSANLLASTAFTPIRSACGSQNMQAWTLPMSFV
jgi:hypothetical protein